MNAPLRSVYGCIQIMLWKLLLQAVRCASQAKSAAPTSSLGRTASTRQRDVRSGLEIPVPTSRSGAIRLLVPRTKHEAEDVVREAWSGPLRVGVCPCSRTMAFVYLIAPLDDPLGSRVPIAEEYWSGHFPSLAGEGIFDRASKVAAFHHRYPLVGTSSWVKGRAVLVGDAAHALPPTLGQGVGLAMTNTSLLADYLSTQPDPNVALAAWQRDWRWITQRTQTWSRRYDWITSEWPDWAYGLRRAVIWCLGKSRRFNSYMRVADRVDAPGRRVLKFAEVAMPRSSRR